MKNRNPGVMGFLSIFAETGAIPIRYQVLHVDNCPSIVPGTVSLRFPWFYHSHSRL
ncbi:hypothetical protein NC799_18250 [Aquibacillus sp. 3ASR75-54]|uniref:Uncharacterized protein n=2 Tax=Aquibacillus salsiterrae TaxID=2950439 RepID=A0A9X3WFB1_9BACI|nr:hypothetical protein [Aquibacillus salsiterrae]